MKNYERLTLHNLTAAFDYELINLTPEQSTAIYNRLAELEDKIEDGELVSKDWHDEQVLHDQAEIERLQAELNKTHENYVAILKHNAYLRNELRESKADAVKEFAERLKEKIHNDNFSQLCDDCNATEEDVFAYIDELLKEYLNE